jgi:uncharacterized protein with HEPN domain
MSNRDWTFRIEDILEAIGRIADYTRDLDFESWQKDQKTIDAVIRNFEIIGEAARHVPESVQTHYPEIPWAKLKGIRNVLIHEYFGVDVEVVWKAVLQDLPGLGKMLKQINLG